MNNPKIKRNALLLFVVICFLFINRYSFSAPEEEHVKAGTQYFLNKEYRQAIEELNKVPDTSPYFVESLSMMGGAYCEIGSYDEAIKVFQQVKFRKPKPEILALIHRYLGDCYRYKGLFKEAIQEYKQSNQIEPVAGTYFALGQAYSNIGMKNEAIKEFEKVRQLDPDSVATLEALSGLYLEMKDYDKCLAIIDEIIKRKPSNQAYLSKGAIYIILDRWDDVIKLFKEMDPVTRAIFKTFIFAARAEKKILVDKNYIIIGFDTSKLGKNREKIMEHLTMANSFTLNEDKTIEEYKKSLEFGETDFAYYMLGSIYLSRDCKKAISYLERAHQLSEDSSLICSTLGSAYAACIGRDYATTFLKTFLKTHPEDPAVLYALAITYYAYKEEKEFMQTSERLKKADNVIFILLNEHIEEHGKIIFPGNN